MAGEHTIRSQRNGKQKAWTVEDIKNGLDLFYEQNKRYPTAREVDDFEFLPSSRSIQRRFGGLVELRKQLGLGETDLRTGEYSSQRAKKINKRAYDVKEEVYAYLKRSFGAPFVLREYFFTDDRRTRTDFFIHCGNGDFSVDVFFADTIHNLIGCLNGKMKTYNKPEMMQYPVIFLHMNDNITSDELQSVVKNKKNKLFKNQRVMTINEFKEFCGNKIPKQK